MVARILFRQESDGWYKFDREKGEAKFLSVEDTGRKMADMAGRDERYDVVKRPENASALVVTAPFAIWHETTHSCNLDCRECGRARVHEKELELGDIKRIYQDFSMSGVFEVRLTGGEACLRRDIDEIVLAAKYRGLFVSLTSNGVYNENIRSRIKERRQTNKE